MSTHTAPDATFETVIGDKATPVTIVVYGSEVYMHDSRGGFSASATLMGPMRLDRLDVGGWYWTLPTTVKAFEAAGFTFDERNRPLGVGDRVIYSRKFCKNVRMVASNDPLVHRTQGGKITALSGDPKRPGTFATIVDTNGHERKALLSNLVHIRAMELDA